MRTKVNNNNTKQRLHEFPIQQNAVSQLNEPSK